jgi:hypothetical protein
MGLFEMGAPQLYFFQRFLFFSKTFHGERKENSNFYLREIVAIQEHMEKI